LGNSSSGLKETPAFVCPTVNIGSRQEGRLRGDNVLDADYSQISIYNATRRALFDDEFRKKCFEAKNPYWLGEAGPKIAKVLAEVPLDINLIRKRMTLRGETNDGWFQ
jgi:UDP-N-acetylglucosamine 2-epimerase